MFYRVGGGRTEKSAGGRGGREEPGTMGLRDHSPDRIRALCLLGDT